MCRLPAFQQGAGIAVQKDGYITLGLGSSGEVRQKGYLTPNPKGNPGLVNFTSLGTTLLTSLPSLERRKHPAYSRHARSQPPLFPVVFRKARLRHKCTDPMALPPAADARVHGKQMERLILALCTLSTWPAVKVQWTCLQHRNLEKAAPALGHS